MQHFDPATRRIRPPFQVGQVGAGLHADHIGNRILKRGDRLEGEIDRSAPHQAEIDRPFREDIAQDQVTPRA